MEDASDILMRELFFDANLAALHDKRSTVEPKDIRLALRIGGKKYAKLANKEILQKLRLAAAA